MKRFELFFTFLQLPIDYLMIVLAGFSAYSLRYTEFIKSIRPIMFDLTWHTYWPIVLLVAGVWIIIFAFSGLYHADPNRRLLKDINRIFFACATGFAGITIYVFFTLQKFDSRFLVLMGWILAVVYVIFARAIIRGLKIFLYSRGFGLRKTVIIGAQNIALRLMENINNQPMLGYKLVGNFETFNEEIANKIKTLKPDDIIFADPKANQEEALSAIDFANENHLSFKYSADLLDTITSNISLSTIDDIPIIELRRTRLNVWGRIFKRILDIVGSLILIIIFSPIYLIVSLIIFIETGRPIIYKNERVGQKGILFFTYKFRSMYQKYCTGAQFGSQGQEALEKEKELIKELNTKTGPVYKINNDPRVTPFGRFIRRWSLDEFPQFFNVFIGNMSLVGPRPHQPREVEKYKKHHKIVLAIKPGITGLAQISGRSDLSFEDEIKLDTFYIENWRLLLDLIILIKTPFVVLSRKGAK
ncbi:MAG TPA: sugar transferase [Candidatus Magasanikbacteria bacterium]|nr:sugar transferase [Candidatus Magasanikbacteria bacterium]